MKNDPILFKPLENKRAFEEVSNRIKQMVLGGELNPGDKLPSENQLSIQFNVGRQTIREALRMLELSGFVNIQRGGTGGAIIQNTIVTKVGNSLIDAIQMENITIEEMTSARLEIEKVVLNHVIDKVDDSDLKKLLVNIKIAKKKIRSGVQAFSENVDFHSLLARGSKNQVLVIVVQSIMTVVAGFLNRLEPSLEHSSLVVNDHADIVDAIIRKDREAAKSLLEKHLLSINARMQESYKTLLRKDEPENRKKISNSM